jgi:hypothetical protein
VPSAEKSKAPLGFFCSGSVASNLADGVHDNHRFEPEADNRAWVVKIFSFLEIYWVYLLMQTFDYFLNIFF